MSEFGLSIDELNDLPLCVIEIGQPLRYLIRLPVAHLTNTVPKIGVEYSHKAIVLDTETTGFDDDDEIIALSYLLVEFDEDMTDIRVVSSDTFYNEPSKPITEEITILTGITNAMVKGMSIAPAMIQMIFEDCDFVAAHHAAFDRKFIEKIKRVDIPWICTVNDLNMQERYGSATSSLASVMAQAFGYYMNHHDSLEDSYACFVLVRDNLKTLLTKAFTPSHIVRIRNSPFEVKEILKSRKYRWNPDEKAWEKSGIRIDDLDEETEWVRSVCKCGIYIEEVLVNERYRS